MKTFWQLILELTAYQKIERDSWNKAAARKTATPKPTVSPSASPSNTHFYTPISDADDERVGLEID